jgi:hypothetical protein
MFSWLTDQVGAAAAGASSTTEVSLANYGASPKSSVDLATILVPQYLQDVPALDGWKTGYEYYLKTGSEVLDQQVMAIRSFGRGGESDGDPYTVTSFEPTDYNQDIVWADGFFVRWPQKPTNN